MAYAYEKAHGELVDWKAWSPELFKKWGAMFGRIHAATKSYQLSDESYRRKEWHEEVEDDLDRIIRSGRDWRGLVL